MANVMGFLREQNTSKTVEQDSSIIVPKDFRHAVCTGSTGSGKSSSFIYSNLDDRIKNGYGVLLFDYKLHEHKSVKYFAHKHNRLDDVLELGLPYGVTCNLIAYMNEKTLQNFSKSLMELNGDNSYWGISASNIVVAIWKSIKSYNEIIVAANDINIKRSFENTLKRFRLPTDLTFTNIVNITQSVNKIATFLKKLQKLSERFMAMTQKKIEDYFEKYGSEASKNKYLILLTKSMNFKSLVANELKSLEVFKDAVEDNSPRSTSFSTLIMAMGMPFSVVGNNKMFNDANGVDIAKALNDGKIIVVSSEELSDSILSSFTGSVLGELSKRSGQTNINPISVFVDEAQRIVKPGLELMEDVLRSSKVDLFLAWQNHSLVHEAIGKTKFLALLQNLNTTFNFKNALDYEDLETSKLETFEYYKNGVDKVYTATPIFLDQNEVFDVELEYLQLNAIYEKLHIEQEDRKKVIEFNSHLYQQGKINLVSRDGKVKTIQLRSKENEHHALQEIEKIIGQHVATLRDKKQTEPRYESLSEAIKANSKQLDLFLPPEENQNA